MNNYIDSSMVVETQQPNIEELNVTLSAVVHYDDVKLLNLQFEVKPEGGQSELYTSTTPIPEDNVTKSLTFTYELPLQNGKYYCRGYVLNTAGGYQFGNWEVILIEYRGDIDYETDIKNKPSINGVTLIGDKTTEELKITASVPWMEF